MDTFSICVALGPLSIYLILIGMLNLSRRSFLVNGMRDTAAMCAACSGLIFVGPVRLFYPMNAAIQFGPFVWLFLLILYVLVVLLIILSQPPRLVIYNISSEQFRIILADVVGKLDPQVRWAGEGLYLPKLGVNLHLERWGTIRNVLLLSSGPNQNRDGWQMLENALRREFQKSIAGRNSMGLVLTLIGIGLLIFVLFSLLYSPLNISIA